MIHAEVSHVPHLYEVELPDGRQLIDQDMWDIVRLTESYRCGVEFVFERPHVRYIPPELYKRQRMQIG